MCGIAGYQQYGGDADGPGRALLESLHNRGPDAGWVRRIGPYAFAQTRLSVIDLSADVRYPMSNETGDVWLAFNGEIYDHELLRRDLQRRGHRFATACDAEVVVHGYEEWGEGVFERLVGMWALAIFDERSGELVLSRDRTGVKPLVYTERGPFAFASTTSALVSAGLARAQADLDALREYLAFHYVPPPRTGLRDVVQLAPGTSLRRRGDGTTTITQWARSPFVARAPRAPLDIDELDEVLQRAVRRQLRADVDVGVFLSGGLDSALVLAYAADAGARPVALTLGFRGHGDYDETPAAAALAQRLGIPHEVDEIGFDFGSAIDEIAAAYDMPFADPSAIATLPLARLARRHVTVALSGTGGDDLFAGYNRHRAHLLAPPPGAVARALTAVTGADARRGGEGAGRLARARSYAIRMAQASSADPLDAYLKIVGSSTSAAGLAAISFDTRVGDARAAVARRNRLGALGRERLDQIQDFELRTYLPGDLLQKEDRATMAYGVEGRVPLLDDAVVALAGRIAPGDRATLRGGKLPLRELGRRRIPRAGHGRRKQGFAVPLASLFAGPWREDAADWLRGDTSEFVDVAAAAALVGSDRAPALDVWALCALCAWERRLAQLAAQAPAYAGAGTA